MIENKTQRFSKYFQRLIKEKGVVEANLQIRTEVEENRPKIVTSFSKNKQKLVETKAYIEKCLEEGKYAMGVEPFEDINATKLLLANIHILEINNEKYNPEVVNALKAMLEDNFADLYDASVEKEYFSTSKINLDPTYKKLVSGEMSSAKDALGDHFDEIPMYIIDQIDLAIDNFNLIDKSFLSEVYEELKFFCAFYKIEGVLYGTMAMMLCSYFNDVEAVKTYLRTQVDFTDSDTIFNDIFLFGDDFKLDLHKFSDDELNSWRELNGKHGKESLNLFILANKLNELEGFNIIEIANNDNAISIISEYAKKLRYERENENTELAAIAREYHTPEMWFDKLLDEVVPNKKSIDLLPDINFRFVVNGNKYSFEKLAIGSYEAFFLGKMTNCCQFYGGAYEKFAVEGFTREDAGFYVVRDSNGRIYAQSYACLAEYEGRDVILFNTFEYLSGGHKLFFPVMKQYLKFLTANTEYTGVFVSREGKVPSLSSSLVNVNPKDPTLYQYEPSKLSSEFTKDVMECDTVLVKGGTKKFQSLEKLIIWNKTININSILELFPEQEELIEGTMYYFSGSSTLNYKLLNEAGVSLEDLADYYHNHASSDTLDDSNVSEASLNELIDFIKSGGDINQIQTEIRYIELLNDMHPEIRRALSEESLDAIKTKCYSLDEVFSREQKNPELVIEIMKAVDLNYLHKVIFKIQALNILDDQVIDCYGVDLLLKVLEQTHYIPGFITDVNNISVYDQFVEYLDNHKEDEDEILGNLWHFCVSEDGDLIYT